jgi:uncharacterized protein
MDPRLSALHVYPIKSTTALDPGEAAVEPWGIAGDRRWMVTDVDGRALTQRVLPRLALIHARPHAGGTLVVEAPGMAPLTVAVPDGTAEPVTVSVFRDTFATVPAGADADAWFSRYLGTPARLVHLDDPKRRPVDPAYALPGETVALADGYPLLLTTTGSLAALNELIAGDSPGHEVPMRRFRPNVVVDGTAPWAEDGWRRVRIGEVDFRVAKPCGRCVVTTVDQATAERDREPLRALGRHRLRNGKLIFGQNLVPLTTGTLHVGDPFTVLA